MLKKIVIIALLVAPVAFGNVTFSDNFENGLSQWTGKNGGAHTGQIVNDPLVSGNHVLNFGSNAAGGDVFTSELISHEKGPIILSFDYLGIPGLDSNGGGFVGISYTDGSSNMWIASDLPYNGSFGLTEPLADDGIWHHYSIVIDPAQDFRIMIEDFNNYGKDPIAGNAYFDNITVTNAVPAPGALILSSLGTGLVGWLRRRK